MVFGWFKKKKEEKREYIDPTEVNITMLRKGAFVDYDLKTWQVTACYEYDWGNEYFSHEFQLKSGKDTIYLHIEDDDELECTIVRKISPRAIQDDAVDYIRKHDNGPMEVIYEGTKYYRESEQVGYFANLGATNWEEFISWSYYDDSGKKVLEIERWDEEEFEASAGIVVGEFEFMNIILP
ncbi:DUF4178 domain-containing protein [Eisenibacter elegans]|jgi:hypothetical protein|uniref:DUF4178 domain-containing protein n=1 Tax=Eisenibacter elegans TaxID=997 RepID=UPI000414E3C0|nr:DUF4178 domain-containing protein [Eisenibacter elegans]